MCEIPRLMGFKVAIFRINPIGNNAFRTLFDNMFLFSNHNVTHMECIKAIQGESRRKELF